MAAADANVLADQAAGIVKISAEEAASKVTTLGDAEGETNEHTKDEL